MSGSLRSPKRAYIVNPQNPLDILGQGDIMWSTMDGHYAVRADDTGVTEIYPSDMVIFDDDLGLMSEIRKVA